MLLLLAVGFIGGAVSVLSPCVLPVLPVILAGSATSDSRRRPAAIVAGLVLSFSAATLLGQWVLSLLHLPLDLLEHVGEVALVVLGVGLAVPWVGHQLERPFRRLGTGRVAGGGGLAMGASLGLVFAPCAGPVLAAITLVGANHRIGVTAVLLTFAYASGAGVPLLVFGLVVRRTGVSWKGLRRRMTVVRPAAGLVLVTTAVLIWTGATAPLQRSLSGYATTIEVHLESGSTVSAGLRAVSGEQPVHFSTVGRPVAAPLPNLGRAPGFAGITAWLNTGRDRPVALSSLRGKVVLVDFWTYSCINCQRELPHVEAWYRDYRHLGFAVVGVHSPEFSFEHVVANVAAATRQLGIHFPVAIDDRLATWNAYGNMYWPAEYLVDQHGFVRATSFGETGYASTEGDIRLLLSAGGARRLPAPTSVPDRTPTDGAALTPETYLGSDRLDPSRYQGSSLYEGRSASYRAATGLGTDDFTLAGTWTLGREALVAGRGARLDLSYGADDVYLVLGGHGTVQVRTGSGATTTVRVGGVPGLYTLVATPGYHRGMLELAASPGIRAYDFTFG